MVILSTGTGERQSQHGDWVNVLLRKDVVQHFRNSKLHDMDPALEWEARMGPGQLGVPGEGNLEFP